MTAIEWLVKELIKEGKLFYDDYECIKQAKEIEKQKTIEFTDGFIYKHCYDRVQKNKTVLDIMEKYYTFKNK